MAYKIETKIGNVWAHPTGKDHIYVEFGHHLNVEKEGDGALDRRGPIEVNGVTYGGSAHMYLYPDGTWGIGPHDKNEYERRTSLYMTRRDKLLQEATESARKKAAAIIRQAVQEWARLNPEALMQAEIGKLQDHLASNADDIQEAKSAVVLLEAKRVSIVAAIQAAENDLALIQAKVVAAKVPGGLM